MPSVDLHRAGTRARTPPNPRRAAGVRRGSGRGRHWPWLGAADRDCGGCMVRHADHSGCRHVVRCGVRRCLCGHPDIGVHDRCRHGVGDGRSPGSGSVTCPAPPCGVVGRHQRFRGASRGLTCAHTLPQRARWVAQLGELVGAVRRIPLRVDGRGRSGHVAVGRGVDGDSVAAPVGMGARTVRIGILGWWRAISGTRPMGPATRTSGISWSRATSAALGAATAATPASASASAPTAATPALNAARA